MKALNNNYKVLLFIILGIVFNVWAYERPLIEAIFALAYLMLFLFILFAACYFMVWSKGRDMRSER
ncbi:hypothetical protein COL10_16385 [Bacillus cereus]|uniref:hypothetical protein n=1 Tax=Bacillus cereus TaxID=1396 RepID=UPI000BF4D3E9|nr:hypothetical protein [Bacillus cereus]PFV09958.1 hypothetical protein COL10_16385 [Bacillus cereus]PGQ98308.1 hypothetical protein COA28_00020 [Bacillus cereus]